MMIQELYEIQATLGAEFTEIEGKKVPLSFSNDDRALQAVGQGVALCDRSHWGRIEVSGDDRLRFIHNQSTNNFNNLQPGQGCDTVFVTSTARTIDLATAYLTADAILLLVSPNRRQKLLELLDRYIFPLDRVQLKDLTNTTVTFSAIGPESHQLLKQLGANQLEDKPYGTHQMIELAGIPVRVAVGSGLATVGYTFFADGNGAANLWKMCMESGAVPMGDRVWEQLRIEQGRPMPDWELTDDYNPLEARLLHTISYDKGCYIGQETIARLNTYKGVKQHLWGIRLSDRVELGTPVTIGDEKVGKLTSLTKTDAGILGLAYIRTKAGGAGLQVQVGGVTGELVDVPFLGSVETAFD